MNNSKPFSINVRDVGKGVLLAVLVAVLGGVQQALAGHGFDFTSWNWGQITDLAATAFVGYLGKQFVSDSQGTPFGKAK